MGTAEDITELPQEYKDLEKVSPYGIQQETNFSDVGCLNLDSWRYFLSNPFFFLLGLPRTKIAL